MARHIIVNGEQWEAQAEQLYCVIDKHGGETYAWSPDGEGFYWYDTEDEAREAGHGGHLDFVDEITDF